MCSSLMSSPTGVYGDPTSLAWALPTPLAPNAGGEPRPKAEAQRTLYGVGSSPGVCAAPGPVRPPGRLPPPMLARAPRTRGSASSCLVRCTRDADDDAHAGLRLDDLRELEVGCRVQGAILRLRALLPTRADQHVEIA